MLKTLTTICIYLCIDSVLCNPVQDTGDLTNPTVTTRTTAIIHIQENAAVQRNNPVAHSQQKDLKDIYARMRSTRCGRPRLKLINIYQELGLVREFGYTIHPECELVPRCQGSGCCGSVISECVAVEKRNVSMKVLTNLSDPTEPPSFQKITLSSDTKCSCQASILPKTHCAAHKRLSRGECVCRQTCATPFIQDPDTCECVCDNQIEEKRCNKILTGERYMGGSHCKCVQDGVCQPVKCNKGLTFNFRLCICETKY